MLLSFLAVFAAFLLACKSDPGSDAATRESLEAMSEDLLQRTASRDVGGSGGVAGDGECSSARERHRAHVVVCWNAVVL